MALVATEPEVVEINNGDSQAVIEVLQQDNDALRAMLQRANNPSSAFRDATASEKLALQTDRLYDELRVERTRRAAAETQLAQTRDHYDVVVLRKDQEIKKLSELSKNARIESEELKKQERELLRTIEQLRIDAANMKTVLKKHGLNFDGTDTMSGLERPQKKIEMKPKQPFSTILRSLTPLGRQRGSTNVSGTGLTPRLSKQQPRDPNSPPRRTGYSTAAPLRQQSRSPQTRSTSVTSSRRAGCTLPEFRVGSQVCWRGALGTVRYVGVVHCLGSGTWFGVELDPNTGEHNGTLSGIRYFTAEPRSSVFCKSTELTQADQWARRRGTGTPRTEPQTPKTAKHHSESLPRIDDDDQAPAAKDEPTKTTADQNDKKGENPPAGDDQPPETLNDTQRGGGASETA